MFPLRHSHSISLHLSSSFSGFKENPTFPWRKPPRLPSTANECTIQPSASSLSMDNSSILVPTQSVKGKVQARSAANKAPLSPIDFLDRAAVVYGDCPSILYNDTTHTWSETHVRCLKIASSLVSFGVKRGDIVSVVAPNVPAMCELHFAVPMAGAILNALNLKLDANGISRLLQHSESKLVFVDIQYASVVGEAVSMFPFNLQRPDLVLIGDGVYENSAVSGYDHDQYQLDYENMVENGDRSFSWIRPDSEWDPISLSYTSGTTQSLPNGVLHCHRGAFLESMNSLIDWCVPRQPVYLWTIPMFHANGWCYTWALAAVGGVNVCLRRFDGSTIYQAIDKYKVTHMCGAPVVLNMLTNHPGSKPLEAPVHIMTAGAPPPAAVLGRAESLGFIVSHGYGLTETSGPVVTCAWKKEWDSLSRPERARLKARQGVNTVGFAEADVVDPESGERVARDGRTMGEIVLRGGSLMVGYLKDEEGTWRCMREDGWFYTGDVGVVHEDGYMEVKDRSKDIIICGGENLSSVEVEAVLYSHPAVNEAAVVGMPDRYLGETPCAFVSLKEEATEKAIREFCKERLPHFMVPRMVVFKDHLPKTSTGKIQKFLLRDLAKEYAKE